MSTATETEPETQEEAETGDVAEVKPSKSKKEKPPKEKPPKAEKTVKATPVPKPPPEPKPVVVAPPKAPKAELKIESILGFLSDLQEDRLVRVLRAISDLTRLKVLEHANGVNSVNDICLRVGQTQPATSHHLRILRDSLLIKPTRDGKQNFYELSAAGVGVLEGIRLISSAFEED